MFTCSALLLRVEEGNGLFGGSIVILLQKKSRYFNSVQAINIYSNDVIKSRMN